MNLMDLVFLLLSAGGCCLIYLSHPRQLLLDRPLRKGPWRVSAGLLWAAAAAWGSRFLSPGTTLFAMLAIVMLVAGSLPFLALFKQRLFSRGLSHDQ